MRDLPRGTVTFLFTDIEGSTALWEQDQAAMRLAVNRHLELLDATIAAHGGHRFQIVGDGVQAALNWGSELTLPRKDHAAAAELAPLSQPPTRERRRIGQSGPAQPRESHGLQWRPRHRVRAAGGGADVGPSSGPLRVRTPPARCLLTCNTA